ncbi:MAG: hypothetical protein ABSG75_11070 [Syntrophales bacterium]|jgi:hypothetical protein
MKRILLIAIATFLLASCAVTPPIRDFNQHATNVYVEPAPGMGVVYFYQESLIGDVSFPVWDDRKKIGGVSPGTYFFYQAAPGDHIFWSETDVKRFFSLKIEAGKKYFIYVSWDEGGYGLGFTAARPLFSLAPEWMGAEAVKSMKYATLAETDRTRDAGR